jgi:hypothetical protein
MALPVEASRTGSFHNSTEPRLHLVAEAQDGRALLYSQGHENGETVLAVQYHYSAITAFHKRNGCVLVGSVSFTLDSSDQFDEGLAASLGLPHSMAWKRQVTGDAEFEVVGLVVLELRVRQTLVDKVNVWRVLKRDAREAAPIRHEVSGEHNASIAKREVPAGYPDSLG